MITERAIRTIALRDVLKGTSPDYHLRRVFRWYGEKFGMSPDAVADLPLIDVLQHYWEDYYETLRETNEAQFIADVQLLGSTEEELAEAKRSEDALDAEAYQMSLRERARAAEEAKKKAEAAQIAQAIPANTTISFDIPEEDLLGGLLDEP